MPDIVIIPNRSTLTGTPQINFVGTSGSGINLQVTSSGSVAFVGNAGSLLQLNDDLSGTLWRINDADGVTVFDLAGDGVLKIGEFDSNQWVITGYRIGIGTGQPQASVHATGIIRSDAGFTSGTTPLGDLFIGGSALALTGQAAVAYTDTRVAASGLAGVNYTDTRVAATGLAGVNYTDTRVAASGLAGVNYTNTRVAATGLAGVNYTDTRVAATGQAAWLAGQANATNISGRLTATGAAVAAAYATLTNVTSTGVTLGQRDLDISGALGLRLTRTGVDLAATASSTYATLANVTATGVSLAATAASTYATLVNVTNTGVTLYQRDADISGALAAQIAASAAGVGTLNGLSGTLNIIGAGSVSVFNSGSAAVVVSGSSVGGGEVTQAQLDSLSGWSASAGNLTQTGVTLSRTSIVGGLTISHSGSFQTPLVISLAGPTFVIDDLVTGDGNPTSYSKQTGISLPGFTYAESSTFSGTLTYLQFDNLQNVNAVFSVSSIPQLKTISCPELTAVHALMISTLTSLSKINLPKLRYCQAGITIAAGLDLLELDLPQLEVCGTTNFNGAHGLISISFPTLRKMGGNGLLIANARSITGVYLPSLQETAGIDTSTTVTGIQTWGSPNLIKCPGNISLTSANMTNVNIGRSGILKEIYSPIISCANQKLTETSVTGILHALASLDGTNGTAVYGTNRTLLLNGGTNAALAGEGLVLSGILAARGVVVRAN